MTGQFGEAVIATRFASSDDSIDGVDSAGVECAAPRAGAERARQARGG